MKFENKVKVVAFQTLRKLKVIKKNFCEESKCYSLWNIKIIYRNKKIKHGEKIQCQWIRNYLEKEAKAIAFGASKTLK